MALQVSAKVNLWWRGGVSGSLWVRSVAERDLGTGEGVREVGWFREREKH